MIRREAEIRIMNDLLKSKKSEFLAVTGRRRVGKTYLIENVFKEKICFSVTGIQNGNMKEQLKNFKTKISEYSNIPMVLDPRNWQEAFLQLKSYLKSLDKKSKTVIFIDELPWIYTKRSNFIQMLAHFWNDYLSKEKHFILIICGSATSWITKKIINDKGGLHNRLTEIIRLMPFKLYEAKDFLKSKSINLNNQELTKIYMAMGGIPFYLEKIRKGESASVAIERICFSEGGALKNEYDNLYKAIFRNSNNHEAIVEVLAKSKNGLTRQEIIKRGKINTGGAYHETMNDLLISGFISEYFPFGGKKHGIFYKLNDEYTVFYHKFIKANKRYTPGIWNQIAASQAYKIWMGYAFESICLKHIAQIKDALGISGVYTEISSIRVEGVKKEPGFQIDLIIDRKDATINLCEIKYYAGSFKIDKSYARKLIDRKQLFIEHTKTKKQVFNTLITNYGVFENKYSLQIVENEVVLDDLMKE